MVAPVNVQMGPDQRAAVLTIANQGERSISFQLRAYAWQQDQAGDDKLVPTDDLLVSPPLATLQPDSTQIVRLVLRRPPQKHESTYRILFDQLPLSVEPGQVRIDLQLSIPVFAEPRDKLTPNVQWRVESRKGQAWLVAANAGTRHETVRDLKLQTLDGSSLKITINSPPHILAGGLRRWPIEANGPPLVPGATVRLTAAADRGEIDQQVRIDAGK